MKTRRTSTTVGSGPVRRTATKCQMEASDSTFQLNHIIIAASLIITAVTFSSCKKDQPVQPAGTAMSVSPGSGAFITDEGNFQGGNAKVSYYHYSDGVATEDLFQVANSRPLGDVCQSMTLINGKEYVVVNNSGKIEVVNPVNFYSVKTITGFTSPRYILQVSASTAYVSDLFANAIKIVDLSTNSISGTIAMPGETEAMVLANGQVFVTSTDHDKVYVLNPAINAVTDSITVAKGGNSICTDVNGKIWVLCYGDYFTSAPGGLYRINASTHLVEQSFAFTTAESPTRLCMNSTADTLFYLDYDLEKMGITSASLPASPFISAGTHSFYGLGINPANNEVYVTDAVDYVQRGHLLRYSRAGVLLDDKVVGIIPGGIYFY